MKTITHEFVEYIPEELKEGVIYVSIIFGTVSHKCFCGCRNEVVTPLSPTDWKLTFDGETISLDPSIGNWNFKCKSHYWIRNGEIHWAGKWTKEEVRAGRIHDSVEKSKYYDNRNTKSANSISENREDVEVPPRRSTIWERLKKWWA